MELLFFSINATVIPARFLTSIAGLQAFTAGEIGSVLSTFPDGESGGLLRRCGCLRQQLRLVRSISEDFLAHIPWALFHLSGRGGGNGGFLSEALPLGGCGLYALQSFLVFLC